MDGARLSLVIPAFNEEAGIGQAIAEADTALARLCAEYEILVIDDGSTDATASAAEAECASRPRVRVLRHEGNRGYGAALRTGFEAAQYDLVAFTDADCQFDLDDLARLLPHAEAAPIVVGHRLDRKDPWRRCVLSRGYNLLARTILGTTVRDIDCALKVFHRDALRRILPESPGFFVNTEMLTRARQQGLDVIEVGVRHRPRTRGQSTVSLREVPRTLGHLLPFWWTRVMFAAFDRPALKGRGYPPTKPGEPGCLKGETHRGTFACAAAQFTGLFRRVAPSFRAGRSRAAGVAYAVAFLLLLACLLFFVRLRAPLLEPQEARYAEIPRLMLEQSRFVVPVLHEQDYLDKPPLFYWMVMASYRIFGVHDWAARIVPGLCGVLTVLLTYLWGRRAFGPLAGFCGALLLCLTPAFIYRGRMLTFDAPLMLFTVAALASAHVAILSGRFRWRWWLVSAVACGLGLLTKGPVALALVVPPLFVVGWLDRRMARVGWRGWCAYLALALLVAVPWYAAMLTQRPDFAAEFFWRHNVSRFVTPFDHAKPMWYYLPGLAIGLMPWTLLVPMLVALLLTRSYRMARRRPAALGLAVASCVWVLVFFSLAGCKRPTYLLPALPPLALALGWTIAVRAPAWRLLLRRGSRLATATTAATLLFAAGIALTVALVQMGKPSAGFVFASVALTALAALLITQRRVSWAVSALVLFVALFAGVREVLPAYNDQFAVRGQVRRLVEQGDLTQRPIVCYPSRYDSVGFYLRGVPVRVFAAHQKRDLIAYLEANPDSLVLIKSGATYREVVADLPAGMVVRTNGQRGAVTVGRVVQTTIEGVAQNR